MKFAYMYASSPEVAYPEIKTLPPLPAITSIQSNSFPKVVDIALNIATVGGSIGFDFSLEVNIFCEEKQVTSYKDEYTPFRASHQISLEDNVSTRYSFIDSFLAATPGIYTFVARLYGGQVPENEEEKKNFLHEAECSIVISKGWK